MMSRRKFWVVLSFCVFMVMIGGNVSAQGTFPERTIQTIVAYPPGGSTDVGARIIADSMQKYLKQPVIVVNKPGGGTAIAGNELFKSKPDGYTIGMFTDMSTAPEYAPDPDRFLYKSKDLQPVAQWSNNCSVLMIRYDDKFTTLEELVKYAKANPGKLRISHTGKGSRYWMEGELFSQRAGIKLIGVPFQGAADAMPALLGGDLDVVLTSWGGVTIGLAEAKKIRVIAITEEKETELLPGVKTLGEFGYPTEVPENYLGAFVTKGTPAGIVSKLSDAFLQATKDPDVKQKMFKIGLAPSYKSPKELEQLVEKSGKFQFKILKEFGILK
jgi:tripartite-type tricarboxylate transporter receptor subunit TctC